RPYDVTAQTLPLLMGVDTDTVEARFNTPAKIATSFEFQSTAPNGVDSWRAAKKTSRIGLYKNYVPAIDEGWTRWLLEDFQFPYAGVQNPDIEAGNLRQRFDVLVFPDQPASQMASGFEPGTMPQEYTGGLNSRAAANLRTFAEQGGTLVFLNRAANYAVDHLHLDVKNVVAGVPNRDFYSPGSLLNATVDTHSPLAYGLPENIAIWSEESPAWEVPSGTKDSVVIRYPEDHLLASGWLLGENYIKGRAALVEVPIGQGRAVLFGFRPQYRAQSYQAFKVFFNSLALSGTRAAP
ncbi:MAG TPA: hypothetical protein VFW44_17390, partial [Bryobacteraceae bacterium]|nr:hypothetical protein [Bryobacteraceae bacterium]